MKITCPVCNIVGEGPRFVRRHFVDVLCANKRDWVPPLTTRAVDDEELSGKSEEYKTAARALRKKDA